MTIFKATDQCFRCPCEVCRKDPDSPGIEEKLATKLTMMQRQVQEDMPDLELAISSGRRCPAHNAEVGGSPHSLHLKGLAVDIATFGEARYAYRIVDSAMVWNIPFIEVAPRHVHIDIRDSDEYHLIIGPG